MADVTSIESIRVASRRLVRELGFMREGLAGTEMPPSAVHALLEISAQEAITAGELSNLLNLEKSSVSRMLRKLIEAGMLKEEPGEPDGRTKKLILTSKGRVVVAEIHDFARRQVAEALGRLRPEQHQTVVDGLRLYAQALGEDRSTAKDDLLPVTIETGYQPGVLARCVEMHALYYARTVGFGRPFEATVAAGLAEFSGRLDNPCNQLWRAMQAGRVVAMIAIDGEDMGPGVAHLRWFIVDDGIRGGGIGRKLLSEAVAFCDRQGFPETHLWTFRGLDAARRLYEASGFTLAEERSGRQWGEEVMEQRFVRRKQAA
ncbi:GNAT family N-acetyltransferase [Microvirga sp. 2MCAF38]|uniref:GNAT family N-acetyltransferase n=1 Tax=Microvirga sp. 2MCAF38 TaxID=3232989 RepID=UPI003F963C2A